MKRLIEALAVGMTATLALAAAVAADGHARVVVPFDLETDGAAEGVTVSSNGDVYTALSGQGTMLRIPGGSGEPEVLFTLDGLAEGDFGIVGLATGHWGEVYAAVASSNPELNGIISHWPESDTWEHLDGTEVITAPNAITASDGFYVSDHLTGTIWEVRLPFTSDDVTTVRELITHPLLQGTGAMPLPFPVGANGIVQRDGTIYVAVTEQSHIVAIPLIYGLEAGEPYVYAELPGAVPDGIAFDKAGNLYAADPPNHTLWKVDPDGEISAVADVDDGLSGPSSVALWESDDGLVAYVSNQAIGDPSTIKHGPSIIAIELD